MRSDVAEAERVAVRCGARDAGGAGRAAGAADVLDHELLAETPCEKMSATMRPVISAGPPAANGTITVPERVG